MSAIPNEIPGFGGAQLSPRPHPSFVPGADFTTEDYFVLSRCDGKATAKDIILMVGLGVAKGCAILGKLRRIGAVLLPGESADSVDPGRAAAAGTVRPRPATETQRRRPISTPDPAVDPLREPTRDLDRVIDLGALTDVEAAAMAEAVELTEREKKRIIEMLRRGARGTLYDLLGVLPETDKKELKRAYFKLSKEFHPDRYYNKVLGTFGPWLTAVFESVTRGFETLSDDRLRLTYVARLRGESGTSAVPQAAQSRTEHAAELFDRACTHEHRGELAEAIKLFAAALRLEPSARYLRRAAQCCLSAGDLVGAAEYAKQGAELRPNDPSYARVLAAVHRAAGRLAEAETTLLGALELKTENDVLLGELRADLAAVRAQRTRSG